jgi:hypothetical protein
MIKLFCFELVELIRQSKEPALQLRPLSRLKRDAVRFFQVSPSPDLVARPIEERLPGVALPDVPLVLPAVIGNSFITG